MTTTAYSPSDALVEFCDSLEPAKHDVTEWAPAALMASDRMILTLVASWPICPRSFDDGSFSMMIDGVDSELVRLQAAWDCVLFDEDMLREICGLRRMEFDRAFKVAKLARLIWPDGRISPQASVVVRGVVADVLPKGRKK